jgi:hypothetical protein
VLLRAQGGHWEFIVVISILQGIGCILSSRLVGVKERGREGVSEKLSEKQRPREREGHCDSCGQMRVAELCCGVEMWI